jgi:O-antigen ligase
VGALLARPGWRPWLGGAALLAGAAAVVVLIGQRMPVLLAALGLVVAGLFLPRLRVPVLAALVAGGVLIATSAAVSPPAFYRLVTKFSRQMADFPDSPYGQIAERAVAITEQHPWTGRGYDGFRTGCAMPRYFEGWHWPGVPAPAGDDGGGAAACVTHPHNHYLQAATDAGLPGLALFCALVGAWLYRLGRGLMGDPRPLRVGLFVAALIQEWPIASTSPLISLPIGAWFFLLLGFGLAEARQVRAVSPRRDPRRAAAPARPPPPAARPGRPA